MKELLPILEQRAPTLLGERSSEGMLNRAVEEATKTVVSVDRHATDFHSHNATPHAG